MDVLFVHNNFPAQFRNIAKDLAATPGVRVAAIGTHGSRSMPGVRLVKYRHPAIDVQSTHPFARRFDVDCHRAEEVLYAATSLAQSGFSPHVIVAHCGWGEGLVLRETFPRARLIVYGEFFYRTSGQDVDFDPEFGSLSLDGRIAVQLKNATTLLSILDCDAVVSPTQWQRSTFPSELQHKIHVIHEGIDTTRLKPDPSASFRLADGREFTRKDEVVTYVARNLEPLRGYHILMRALPRLLQQRPNAHILIVGGDGTSYGAQPPAGTTWKAIYHDEVAEHLDSSRVHFLGRLPYQRYQSVLQVSSVHVYLTYPFVLSWSMLEAMSVGCLLIASDTSPVREVVRSGNGILTPFFDSKALADQITASLAARPLHDQTAAAARQTILSDYDMEPCVGAMKRLIVQ